MSIFSWKKKEDDKAPLRAPQLDVQRLRQTMGLPPEPIVEKEAAVSETVNPVPAVEMDIQEAAESGTSLAMDLPSLEDSTSFSEASNASACDDLAAVLNPIQPAQQDSEEVPNHDTIVDFIQDESAIFQREDSPTSALSETLAVGTGPNSEGLVLEHEEVAGVSTYRELTPSESEMLSEIHVEQEVTHNRPLTFDTVRIPAPMLQHLEKVAEQEPEIAEPSSFDNDRDPTVSMLWSDEDAEQIEKKGMLQFLPAKRSWRDRLKKGRTQPTEEDLKELETFKTQTSGFKSFFRYGYSLLKTLSLVLVLIYFFSSYVIQRNEVTGVAMEPALFHQDQILINRLGSYFGSIKRGDIVSIRSDRLSERVQVGELIKRVIAVGGDTVEIKNGRVFINDQLLDEPYLPDTTETLPIDLTYQKVILDKNQYYILGDNRNDSLDSRYFGPVLDSDIVGVCWLRIAPWSRFGRP